MIVIQYDYYARNAYMHCYFSAMCCMEIGYLTTARTTCCVLQADHHNILLTFESYHIHMLLSSIVSQRTVL